MSYLKFVIQYFGITPFCLALLLYQIYTGIKSDLNLSNCSEESVNYLYVVNDVQIKNYFQYIDSVVNSHKRSEGIVLTEHLLVRHNSWIIEALYSTDYYRMIEKDSFVYDQKELVVLKKGQKIRIPEPKEIVELQNIFNRTRLDLNIPEFKLRILKDSLCLFEFPVRVGRNEKKYLKMGDRVTDLKTKHGGGYIVNHVRDPDFYNPVNGQKYFLTRRDDNKTTKLPQIPYIETEIDGIRNGQMIHPTTNPKTLGSAYSNGCIGVSEGDAWIIYYYAPIGTKITIRYDLKMENEEGETEFLKDIYSYN